MITAMTKRILMIVYKTAVLDRRARAPGSRDRRIVASSPRDRPGLERRADAPDVHARRRRSPGTQGWEISRPGGVQLSAVVRPLPGPGLDRSPPLAIGRGCPHVIHVHNMPNFLVLAALPFRLAGAKVVLDVHDTLIETFASKFSGVLKWFMNVFLRIEERLSCAIAHRVIAVNDVQKQVLLDRGIDAAKLLMLMNIPDPKRFAVKSRSHRNAHDDQLKLVYFGTITTRLGVDLAIRAIHGIHERYPGIELHVLGNGEDRDECVDLAKRLGMDEKVHFGRYAPVRASHSDGSRDGCRRDSQSTQRCD